MGYAASQSLRSLGASLHWEEVLAAALIALVSLIPDDRHSAQVIGILSDAADQAPDLPANQLIELLLTRFPTYLDVSEEDHELALLIGKLARHDSQWHRDAAVSWLRQLPDDTTDPEPDIMLHTKAWHAWCDRPHEPESVMLALVCDSALRREELCALRRLPRSRMSIPLAFFVI
ncbi:hypothetical protein [Actinocorallia lasiicapitis]